MGTVCAIANQKGGVGKTTTAVNVAACIAEAGYETLLVDVDPQANATVGLRIDRTHRPGGYEILAREAGRARPRGCEHRAASHRGVRAAAARSARPAARALRVRPARLPAVPGP